MSERPPRESVRTVSEGNCGLFVGINSPDLRRLDVEVGDEVEVVAEDGEIRITPAGDGDE